MHMMKRVMLTAFIGLLSTALLLDPQPVFADGCTNSVNDSAQLCQLEHTNPVTPGATLTATRVPMSTVSLAGSVDGTIIPPVATVRHTAKTVEATPVPPEMDDGSMIYTLLRQLGQLVMGFPWRGVILPLPPIDLRTCWQWVMWVLETWLK